MQHTIGEIFVIRTWIADFIEDTDYKLKLVNRDVEPGDIFSADRETGNIVNYGQIDDIIRVDEFKEWLNKKGGK